MGKECGAWVSRRLWGGGNTSPLKTTAWEAISNVTIVSIERIQNPQLYQAYQLRKEKMDRDNGGSANERQLFHGTSPESVTKINTQGFNRSFSGTANGK